MIATLKARNGQVGANAAERHRPTGGDGLYISIGLYASPSRPKPQTAESAAETQPRDIAAFSAAQLETRPGGTDRGELAEDIPPPCFGIGRDGATALFADTPERNANGKHGGKADGETWTARPRRHQRWTFPALTKSAARSPPGLVRRGYRLTEKATTGGAIGGGNVVVKHPEMTRKHAETKTKKYYNSPFSRLFCPIVHNPHLWYNFRIG